MKAIIKTVEEKIKSLQDGINLTHDIRFISILIENYGYTGKRINAHEQELAEQKAELEKELDELDKLLYRETNESLRD